MAQWPSWKLRGLQHQCSHFDLTTVTSNSKCSFHASRFGGICSLLPSPRKASRCLQTAPVQLCLLCPEGISPSTSASPQQGKSPQRMGRAACPFPGLGSLLIESQDSRQNSVKPHWAELQAMARGRSAASDQLEQLALNPVPVPLKPKVLPRG